MNEMETMYKVCWSTQLPPTLIKLISTKLLFPSYPLHHGYTTSVRRSPTATGGGADKV
jgi:hypothetical protein